MSTLNGHGGECLRGPTIELAAEISARVCWRLRFRFPYVAQDPPWIQDWKVVHRHPNRRGTRTCGRNSRDHTGASNGGERDERRRADHQHCFRHVRGVGTRPAQDHQRRRDRSLYRMVRLVDLRLSRRHLRQPDVSRRRSDRGARRQLLGVRDPSSDVRSAPSCCRRLPTNSADVRHSRSPF
jgi:hypothetical protein